MDQYNPGYRQPVRSLQNFLRTISQFYRRVPPVIPDGIFGEQTRAAVLGFQATFSLPQTGEVDNDVWDHIISVYDSIVTVTAEPRHAKIFPTAETVICPNGRNSCLYSVQGMLLEITQRFTNLGSIQITGVHNADSVNVVKNIQAASGLEVTGNLDQFTWNSIARIYEVFIADDRAQALEQTPVCRSM